MDHVLARKAIQGFPQYTVTYHRYASLMGSHWKKNVVTLIKHFLTVSYPPGIMPIQ